MLKDIGKKSVLYILCLLAFWLCGAVVMKIFDWIMKLEIENIVYEGFKVGFIAWLLVSILPFFTKKKKELQ